MINCEVQWLSTSVIKGIIAAKIGQKSFGTFVKQAPDYDEGLPLDTSALLPFLTLATLRG